jgi:hypothetical protein
MGQRLSAVLVNRLSGLPGYEQTVDILEADIQRVFSERERETLDAESNTVEVPLAIENSAHPAQTLGRASE